MTWWSDFFDSLLFLNMLRSAGFKMSCLPALWFFKLERAFMLADLFMELLYLDFDTFRKIVFVEIKFVCSLKKGQVSLFCRVSVLICF